MVGSERGLAGIAANVIVPVRSSGFMSGSVARVARDVSVSWVDGRDWGEGGLSVSECPVAGGVKSQTVDCGCRISRG